MKADISRPDQIRLMVDSFYQKVGSDQLLAPIFNDFAGVDWSQHLPQMYTFWESLLLGTVRYQGRPFPKHAPLPIGKEHFKQWVDLFEATVDEHFAGPKADEAKGRARAIALVFMGRLGLLPNSSGDSLLR